MKKQGQNLEIEGQSMKKFAIPFLLAATLSACTTTEMINCDAECQQSFRSVEMKKAVLVAVDSEGNPVSEIGRTAVVVDAFRGNEESILSLQQTADTLKNDYKIMHNARKVLKLPKNEDLAMSTAPQKVEADATEKQIYKSEMFVLSPAEMGNLAPAAGNSGARQKPQTTVQMRPPGLQ